MRGLRDRALLGLMVYSFARISAALALEHAQQIAAHESPRTTKLYGRTNDELTLDEIERIQL